MEPRPPNHYNTLLVFTDPGALMPTYEYACSACGHTFEEFQSIKAKPTIICPKCKKKKVQRLISAGAGFIFKGSGFYQTDYRSEAYKTAAKADSAPAKTDSKTETKTDTSATKSDAKPAQIAKSAKSTKGPAAA
jgi:putative FmdB family regulatory protein